MNFSREDFNSTMVTFADDAPKASVCLSVIDAMTAFAFSVVGSVGNASMYPPLVNGADHKRIVVGGDAIRNIKRSLSKDFQNQKPWQSKSIDKKLATFACNVRQDVIRAESTFATVVRSAYATWMNFRLKLPKQRRQKQQAKQRSCLKASAAIILILMPSHDL